MEPSAETQKILDQQNLDTLNEFIDAIEVQKQAIEEVDSNLTRLCKEAKLLIKDCPSIADELDHAIGYIGNAYSLLLKSM